MSVVKVDMTVDHLRTLRRKGSDEHDLGCRTDIVSSVSSELQCVDVQTAFAHWRLCVRHLTLSKYGRFFRQVVCLVFHSSARWYGSSSTSGLFAPRLTRICRVSCPTGDAQNPGSTRNANEQCPRPCERKSYNHRPIAGTLLILISSPCSDPSTSRL